MWARPQCRNVSRLPARIAAPCPARHRANAPACRPARLWIFLVEELPQGSRGMEHFDRQDRGRSVSIVKQDDGYIKHPSPLPLSRRQRAVVGSMTVLISTILLAGKPESRECSRIAAS